MNPKRITDWPGRIAKVCAVIVALVGVAALLGWAFDIEHLKSVLPGWTQMAWPSAICFVLSGVALWSARAGLSPLSALGWKRLWQISAAIVALAGLVITTERMAGLHTSTGGAEMPTATALCFLLFGISILLSGKRRFDRASEMLVLVAGFIAWLGISRYVFGVESASPFGPMAAHSAVAFLVLSVGALGLPRKGGLMSLILANNAGGQTARRLLLPILIVSLLANWAESQAERVGWFAPGATKALFTASDILVLAILILLNASWLNRSETKRQAAEESLREISERTRAIVEGSEDAIISKTLDGRITTWNRAAEKLFGYSSAEALGQSMLMIFPPERVNEEQEILQRIAKGETIDHFETVRLRKDGTRIDISATLSPLRDRDGKIIGASKIARDITERKKGEAKLQTQLARLDLLHRITRAIGEHQDLQSIYQVVIRSLEDHLPIDFGCICLYDDAANAFIVTRVGVKSESLAMELAMPEKSAIPVDANGLSRCLEGHLVYEPNIGQSKSLFPQRLAQTGLAALVLAPLLVESRVFGILVVARRQSDSFSSTDCEFLRQLSEHTGLAAHQAQLHDALQRSYDDLRQTQHAVMQQERLRALGEMASGVAHDINNALSPVMLYTGMLMELETGLSDSARGHLETVQRAVSDVVHTISRLKEFYRQREEQLTLHPVQLNKLVRQVVDLSRPRWHDVPQERGVVIEMRTDLAPDLPEIMGVESEIREALVNLVFNASDAMPTGGTVTLRTKQSENKVVVEVADSGTGMDEPTRRRCLEPFFTTKGERGTGLGLAMVYGIVQRHSAELEIQSELGKGTTISLVFPVMQSTTPGVTDSPSVTATLPRLRLLVVDDDPLLLQALRDALEAAGHSVMSANGGQAGIDAFDVALKSGSPFDLVFTDLGMPHIDGRAVATAIKARSAGTPVILLTGWGKRLASEGDVPAHVDHVLSKPPKPVELREAISRCYFAAAARIT